MVNQTKKIPRAGAKANLDDSDASDLTAAQTLLLTAAATLADAQPEACGFVLKGSFDGYSLHVRIAVEKDNEANV